MHRKQQSRNQRGPGPKQPPSQQIDQSGSDRVQKDVGEMKSSRGPAARAPVGSEAELGQRPVKIVVEPPARGENGAPVCQRMEEHTTLNDRDVVVSKGIAVGLSERCT